MNKLKSCVILGVVILMLPFSSLADELENKNEVLELGELVVTGTRTERDVTEIPAAVGVVTKKEIEESRN